MLSFVQRDFKHFGTTLPYFCPKYNHLRIQMIEADR